MLHAISLSAVLVGTWVLLSGHYTALLLSFGALSIALAVGFALRMDVVDRESHPLHLTWRIPAYWFWLLVQIVKSNIDVAKIVLGRGPAISPTVVRVKAGQRSEIGQVIYANSITLTPGTISMELEDDIVTVHALTAGTAADLETGEMDRKVTALEGSA